MTLIVSAAPSLASSLTRTDIVTSVVDVFSDCHKPISVGNWQASTPSISVPVTCFSRRHHSMLYSTRAGGYSISAHQNLHSYPLQQHSLEKSCGFTQRTVNPSSLRPPHQAIHHNHHLHHYHHNSPHHHHHNHSLHFNSSSNTAYCPLPFRQKSAAVHLQEFMLHQWRNFECRTSEEWPFCHSVDNKSSHLYGAFRNPHPGNDNPPAAIAGNISPHSSSQDNSSWPSNASTKGSTRNHVTLSTSTKTETAAAEPPFYRHRLVSTGDGMAPHQALRHSSSLETVPWQRGYSIVHKTRQNSNNNSTSNRYPHVDSYHRSTSTGLASPIRVHSVGRPHRVSVSPGGWVGGSGNSTDKISAHGNATEATGPFPGTTASSVEPPDAVAVATDAQSHENALSHGPIDNKTVSMSETLDIHRHRNQDLLSPLVIHSSHTVLAEAKDSPTSDCSVAVAQQPFEAIVHDGVSASSTDGACTSALFCLYDPRNSPNSPPYSVPVSSTVPVTSSVNLISSSASAGDSIVLGGEQYWTPDPPASPANSLTNNSHGEKILSNLVQVQLMTLDGLSDVD